MSENKEFEKVLDKAKVLENIDFLDGNNFNHDEYYDVIKKIAEQNQHIKDQEAEEIIKKQADNYIDNEFISELNKKRNVVESFIRKYDPNKSEFLKGMPQNDVDKIYAISNYLLNAYIQYVNEMDFNFTLTKQEVIYINKILTKDLWYDGDEVFNYTQLMEDFWNGAYEEYKNNMDKEEFTYKVSIKKILILHHLIKNHKERGNSSVMFRNILYKIAQTNKVFNAYSIIIERIKSDRELWGNALDQKWLELNPQEKEDVKERTGDVKEEN